MEKPAYELEQKIKEYFGSYRCLLQEDPPMPRPSRKNDRDDRAFIDFDRTIITERPVIPQPSQQGNRGNVRPSQNNYDRDDGYNNNRQTNNNDHTQQWNSRPGQNMNDRGVNVGYDINRQTDSYDGEPQGNRENSRPSQHGYDTIELNDGYNNNRQQNKNERDNVRSTTQSVASVGTIYDDRRPGGAIQSQNERRNPYDQYENKNDNNRNTPKSNPEPIYFPSNDNRDTIQPSFNRNTDTVYQNSPNQQKSQSNQTPYYPQSNRDLITSSTPSTHRTTQSTSRRTEQPQRTSTPSRNRLPSSSQVQPSIQTSGNPVYRTTITQSRTTTQPTHSYYEYSRLI